MTEFIDEAPVSAGPGQPGLTAAQEEAAFYHETALNAAWIGSRLTIGVLSFFLGSFIFAFFYLRSVNSHDLWYPAGFHGPGLGLGTLIMALVVVSAVAQTVGLIAIKAASKTTWLVAAGAALVLGLAAISLQIWQLLNLSFWPGANGFASVFTGGTPVYLVIALAALIWLETLIMRCRAIPAIAFVEQPPTFAEAFAVQRFQSGLSAFTVVWNYLTVVAVIMWVLFYLVH